jgi:hypothetical protein
MKVRNFIKFLMDFDMDAEIVVSTNNTFYDYEEMDISWGGENCGDGATKEDAEFIYINNLIDNKEENYDTRR